mmetsp:Transcript_25720/g.53463  ORF Transcript_25720/g.53463 Transcript_25720/m.53463 type:complete len:237 (+) Transcript_25720:48-758(+)
MMNSATALRPSASSPHPSSSLTASSLSLLASSLAPSRPMRRTYVALSAVRSFPAVLPSVAESAVTSRMSSATWKARPMLSAKASRLSTCPSSAPPSIAPAATDTLSSAAVLCLWIHLRSSRVTADAGLPSHSRSRACPPARPTLPTLAPSRPTTSRRRRCGSFPGIFAASVYLTTYSKAVERRLSPARIATSSPYTLWQVGIPRRRSSSSMDGRSSCMRDMVWIISTARAEGRQGE